MRTIQRVAVLGAGTMGSRIAAHFANAGIPSVLLDVTPELARKGVGNAAKQRPGAFFLDSSAVDDHDGQLRCTISAKSPIATGSWKRSPRIWRSSARCGRRWRRCASRSRSFRPTPAAFRCARSRKDSPPAFRKHFLGTHFFNPPRYLHLLEVIPGADTDPAILEFVSSFADRRLGKGVVPCKDTPNFIANRIGSFFGGTVQKITHGRRLHRRGSGRDHRLADRAAEQRELPAAGYGRPGRVGVRRHQSVSRGSGRSVARAVPDGRTAADDDRAQMARRQNRRRDFTSASARKKRSTRSI